MVNSIKIWREENFYREKRETFFLLHSFDCVVAIGIYWLGLCNNSFLQSNWIRHIMRKWQCIGQFHHRDDGTSIDHSAQFICASQIFLIYLNEIYFKICFFLLLSFILILLYIFSCSIGGDFFLLFLIAFFVFATWHKKKYSAVFSKRKEKKVTSKVKTQTNTHTLLLNSHSKPHDDLMIES